MKGNVVSRDNNGLTIALHHSPEDGCAACGLGDSCTLPKSESIHVDYNSSTKDLSVNDLVDVEITPGKLIGLSALVYITPLALMFAGGLWGNRISEAASILMALGGLGLGLFILTKLDKILKTSDIIYIRRLQ